MYAFAVGEANYESLVLLSVLLFPLVEMIENVLLLGAKCCSLVIVEP